MAELGHVSLVVAFVAAIVSVVGLAVGGVAGAGRAGGVGRASGKLALVGRLGAAVSCVALLCACGLLAFCFMTGDVSLIYVLENRSLSSSPLAWLYRLSGVWAGRAGSLLFWTLLISVFNMVILVRAGLEAMHRRTSVQGSSESLTSQDAPIPAMRPKVLPEVRLDDLACMVVSLVVAVFCGVLLFSEGNMPFEPTPAPYFEADGQLSARAQSYSMNRLLEHWAMAVHPPLLFVGYAGLTVPFAYAIAALIASDPSKRWVQRSQRFVLASWLFLGAGIGLGAVWAYVVLGWGGYWGWDPVENASFLPWLICVALVHTFTVYRQRGAFKRWALLCACLAFAFVILATFITRSGIVQSVHAFAGDPVSLALFGGLVVLAILVPIVLIVVRWRVFCPDREGADDVENLLSKDAAYYFNNVVMVLFAVLLTYMTLTSALPSWLPFGGDSLGVVAYEAVARPLGIAYLLILAVCPLLAWGKTDAEKFWRRARVPALCALVLFALLAFWWATELLPVYDAVMAKGNANSETLLEAGPSWYYNGLALVGLLVASLLVFNAGFMFVRGIRASRKRGAAIGGSFAHLAMAVILVGLIGSNMYVYEETGYMNQVGETAVATADDGEEVAEVAEGAEGIETTETEPAEAEATDLKQYESFDVREYRLEYVEDSIVDETAESGAVIYAVTFDVYKNGAYVGRATPAVQLDTTTQQQKLDAAVLSFPEEDLFVVYRGVNAAGDFSLDVRINPLISLVWIGFALLMAGTLAALVMPRRRDADGGGNAEEPLGARGEGSAV